jgi:hypothetical protein
VSDVLERIRKWDAAVGVDEAIAKVRAEERALIVAFILRQAENWKRGEAGNIALKHAALMIDHGHYVERREDAP